MGTPHRNGNSKSLDNLNGQGLRHLMRERDEKKWSPL